MTFLQTIVTIADLENLIENEVREGLHLEYKEAMPGRANSDKVPFLAAVSAFANTSGGDFYLGIAADDGLPTAITGTKCPEVDKEILRLEGIIRNGLEPPLSGVQITCLKKDANAVFRLHIPRSWNAPHRVKKCSFLCPKFRGEIPIGSIRNSKRISFNEWN